MADYLMSKTEKYAEILDLVGEITYKPGWYFRTGITGGDGDKPLSKDSYPWIQVGVTTEAEISWDMIEKKKVAWRGSKQPLSWYMCRNEIVDQCYHAIERAEMHELREWFRFRGRAIHNPHIDPEALVEVAKWKKNFNVRENAMTMDEP